eukprot:23472-Prorocentrum_minimum.AAC.5
MLQETLGVKDENLRRLLNALQEIGMKWTSPSLPKGTRVKRYNWSPTQDRVDNQSACGNYKELTFQLVEQIVRLGFYPRLLLCPSHEIREAHVRAAGSVAGSVVVVAAAAAAAAAVGYGVGYGVGYAAAVGYGVGYAAAVAAAAGYGAGGAAAAARADYGAYYGACAVCAAAFGVVVAAVAAWGCIVGPPALCTPLRLGITVISCDVGAENECCYKIGHLVTDLTMRNFRPCAISDYPQFRCTEQSDFRARWFDSQLFASFRRESRPKP